MKVMSFREFLGLKGIKIKNLKMEELQIKPLFYEYLKKGGFPEFVNENDEDFIKNQVKAIILDKIIY